MILYGVHLKAKYSCFPGTDFTTTSKKIFKTKEEALDYIAEFKLMVIEKLEPTILKIDEETIETKILDYEVQ
jgi:hypothetical protein